ncbi:MAG TPA: 30S ribosomal protein S1 [Spirochaetia bacterium]|nr:30S ribosomal protein S1 [Spirochaetia bacterium]
MSDRSTKNAEVSDLSSLQEELQEQYLKSLDELEVGQLVDGRIVEVGTEQVFIDVGYKSEGKIPIDEFDEKPTVGDIVSVVLVNKESTTGEVIVSKKKADEKVFWKNLRKAFQDHEPIEGTVEKSIKGGFEILLGHGVRGFNPISKMDLHRVEEPEEYVGLKSRYYIDRLYSDNRVNIVLSRRAWLEEEVEKKRGEFFEHVKIGDVIEGIVKSFTSFGSFIDLGGFDGLLHINDMSWGHVTRPKDFVKKGQRIMLKVIRMDPEDKKINLSLKHMTEDPWNLFEDKYQVDQVVKGKVTKLTDFGAFVELEEGIEGLAHISELSWVKRISHPKELLKIGDEVEAKILAYDIPNGKVSLGLKQVLPNPWDDMEARYPVGTRLKRPVKKLTSSGAFIELEEGIDGFLHADDLSWTKKLKYPSGTMQEGEEVECMVIHIDPQTHNIRLGVKQLEDDPWESLRKAYPERTVIEGEITNITDFGVFVRVPGGIEGLIGKAGFSDPRIEPYEKAVLKYKVGDSIRAVVNEISPSRQRLSLSLRDLERKAQAEELKKYIQDDEIETTFTIGDYLKDERTEEEEHFEE